jgi:hypothetical protein
MLNRFFPFIKASLSVLIIATFAFFLAQAVFTSSLNAAEPGDPGYQFPVLQEKDFELFLDLVKFQLESPEEDAQSFSRKHNVTEGYVQAVVLKITMNRMAEMSNDFEWLTEEYGATIVFTPAEETIFLKYEDQIVEGLEILGSTN